MSQRPDLEPGVPPPQGPCVEHLSAPPGPEALQQDLDRAARRQAVQHGQLQRVLGIDTPDGSPIIRLEPVDGPSLADLLADEPLHPEDAVAMARQVAGALHALHRNSLHHGVISPDSIRFNAQGEAVLLGAAETIRPSPMSEQVRRADAVQASYLPPEALDPTRYDPIAGDLYALGVLLHHALTGARPYTHATSAMAVLLAKRTADGLQPLAPAGFDPVPEPLTAWVATLTARDPADRPSSAQTVLRKLLELELTPATTPVVPSPPGSTAEPALTAQRKTAPPHTQAPPAARRGGTSVFGAYAAKQPRREVTPPATDPLRLLPSEHKTLPRASHIPPRDDLRSLAALPWSTALLLITAASGFMGVAAWKLGFSL